MLPEPERYELGQKLGDVIRLCVEVIAVLEHVQPEDVFEEIVESYVAGRIIDDAEP
jgi:hypothetical protein